MTPKDAYAKIYADPKLQKAFSENPIAVLAELGVESPLIVVKTNVPKPAGALPTPGSQNCACVSIGCIVCGDVGA
ncbi:MAG: hypothetical protein P9L99_07610 [Candidatus Lernaella stagnicola]|nr:hypothetical protein [Candidatus Lernaella stagnicola]